MEFLVLQSQAFLSGTASTLIPASHFPSRDNRHSAQQTDKYLIGQQPSAPPPHTTVAAARVGTRICVLGRSLGIKARVGKQLGAAHLRTPLQLVLVQPLFLLVICAHLPGRNR